MADTEKYVLEMRKAFSHKNCVMENGHLNHKYFQTKLGQYWTEEEDNLLLKGIAEFGVGAWEQIKNKYLKGWTETDLKLRSGCLFRCFNLGSYSYRTFSREEIQKIAEQNEKEGREKGKFKNGIYYN